ncbi:hypothetical protein AFIC_001405 [[Pseudomonas] carboxydohydrogena]|uniref:Uncharacterized protein n=2 Tax=Afipia carboxydohydrogena TaxID=290 RepID=A0ABY8BVC7_AFICR|nr:hypothetical protein [[Pseudomonas] carboxydohydrogena]WEF52896.1 hypothetical protein AFIC_001405 [[Pseudomonas] carboxydohydrogena]
MMLIVAAVVLFAVAFIVALFRSRRPLAVGAVVVIVLLVVGLAATSLTHDSSARQQSASVAAPTDFAALPALACLDELAGEAVEAGCERAVFASAEATAAAVSYTAAQISRLESHGDVASANKVMTPALRALRRAVERDRFGIVAHVLATRDECTLSKCAFFASLTNTAQIANNMNERVYDALVTKHASVWGQPVPSLPPVAGVVPPTEPERPTGKPVSGDFPSSASIPPISIMAPEPATASVPAKPAEPAHATPKAAAPKAAAKKPAPSHPRPLTPPAADSPAAAPAPENNR